MLEDFHLREKITHFNHEQIPERVVHARGAAAHGVFRAYGNASTVTRAGFLVKDVETPVFVRFSTVLGSRGSADTVRDVCGFAVNFYTVEGNFDLVGDNMPVLFVQDGIVFPDTFELGRLVEQSSSNGKFMFWSMWTPSCAPRSPPAWDCRCRRAVRPPT